VTVYVASRLACSNHAAPLSVEGLQSKVLKAFVADDEPRPVDLLRRRVGDDLPISIAELGVEHDAGELDPTPHGVVGPIAGSEDRYQVLRSGLVNDLSVDDPITGYRDLEDISYLHAHLLQWCHYPIPEEPPASMYLNHDIWFRAFESSPTNVRVVGPP